MLGLALSATRLTTFHAVQVKPRWVTKGIQRQNLFKTIPRWAIGDARARQARTVPPRWRAPLPGKAERGETGKAPRATLVQPPVTTLTPPSTASHWPVMCLPASDAYSSRTLQVFIVAQAAQGPSPSLVFLAQALSVPTVILLGRSRGRWRSHGCYAPIRPPARG